MSPLLHEFLQHILEEADYLMEESAKLTREQLMQDRTLKRAFVRSLEIIGEATKHIPEAIRIKYPDAEWRNIAGMRDRMIHAYFGIDYSLVWLTVTDPIPSFRNYIHNILRAEPTV
jgi:uncharacterized protein with HEPN domain